MKPEIEITTLNPEDTRKVGEIIGENLSPDTIITLYGDLGAGKTTFVQGVAKGLEVPEDYYVTSPTYSIINEYPGRIPFFHLDLYRIYDVEELYEIGFEEIVDEKGVMAIEWPQRLPENFFSRYMKIDITSLNEDVRKISVFTYGLKLPDLIQKLSNLKFS